MSIIRISSQLNTYSVPELRMVLQNFKLQACSNSQTTYFTLDHRSSQVV